MKNEKRRMKYEFRETKSKQTATARSIRKHSEK